MLVFQTSPVGVKLFSYVNAFFCSNKREAECIVPASLACETGGVLVSFSLKNVVRKVRDKAAWKQNRGQKRKRWVKGRGWPQHCAQLPAFFLLRPSPSNFELFLGKNTNEKHTKKGLLSGYISTHIFNGVKYYQVLPVYCIPFTNRNSANAFELVQRQYKFGFLQLTINFPWAGLRTPPPPFPQPPAFPFFQ